MKILTFDIEEWFLSTNNKRNPPDTWLNFENRVEKNTAKILELLEVYNTRATFFILGWIAEQYPGLVSRIAEAGHEIGYHTYFHQSLSAFTKKAFREDLQRGMGLLEDLTGVRVTTFRAPFFALNSTNEWVYEVLLRQGINTSSSIKAAKIINGVKCGNNPIVMKHISDDFIEFPLSRVNLFFYHAAFSGGGYFRILPLNLLKKLFENQTYIMTYFHPRDFDTEIDYSRNLSLMRNLRNLAGAKSGVKKFEWLLANHRFLTIGMARKEVSEKKTYFQR